MDLKKIKVNCLQKWFEAKNNISQQNSQNINLLQLCEQIAKICVACIACFGLINIMVPHSCAKQSQKQQNMQQQEYVIVGKPRVVDGDTLVIGGDRIRLLGIDAPEKKQLCKGRFGGDYECGSASKSFLSSLIGSEDVFCEARNKDLYGRFVAKCFLPQVIGYKDINDDMVRQGWAVAYKKFSKDYISAEEEAVRQKKGIWQGDFQDPADFRKQARK